MMAADPASEKRRLRQALRSLLRELSPGTARAAGLQIAEHLSTSDFWQNASRVVLFSSRPDEVDMSSVWQRASLDGKIVLLPRMTGAGSLEFAVVDDRDRLAPGRYDILEPPREAGPELLSGDDLVLVPGLAFDSRGGRLGRGGGYYDRAFAADRRAGSRPVLIGVGFSFQVIEHVPTTTLDVRMDGLVSELGLSSVGRDGEGSIR